MCDEKKLFLVNNQFLRANFSVEDEQGINKLWPETNSGSVYKVRFIQTHKFNIEMSTLNMGLLFFLNYKQKQPSRGVLKKRCCEIIQQNYRTPMQSNFIEIVLRHGCYFLAYFQNTFFLKTPLDGGFCMNELV